MGHRVDRWEYPSSSCLAFALDFVWGHLSQGAFSVRSSHQNLGLQGVKLLALGLGTHHSAVRFPYLPERPWKKVLCAAVHTALRQKSLGASWVGFPTLCFTRVQPAVSIFCGSLKWRGKCDLSAPRGGRPLYYPRCQRKLSSFNVRYGLNCILQNLYVEALTPDTWECDCTETELLKRWVS